MAVLKEVWKCFFFKSEEGKDGAYGKGLQMKIVAQRIWLPHTPCRISELVSLQGATLPCLLWDLKQGPGTLNIRDM